LLFTVAALPPCERGVSRASAPQREACLAIMLCDLAIARAASR
jgi:hypothetical protein